MKEKEKIKNKLVFMRTKKLVLFFIQKYVILNKVIKMEKKYE